ncbi:hypothetical protein DSO57_1014256 [Entomophthora muscae]|uniref:Uncharacterized protein n=1 Tax=Entomophthora muscae TaxID=34485 RepID=A0ACC2UQU7_9FUNG|nr:hypothetical protein DSO57_1014256 [Entomophthora muscae]
MDCRTAHLHFSGIKPLQADTEDDGPHSETEYTKEIIAPSRMPITAPNGGAKAATISFMSLKSTPATNQEPTQGRGTSLLRSPAPPAPLPTVFCPPGAPFGPIHFTEYPLKPKYKDYTPEKILKLDPLARIQSAIRYNHQGLWIFSTPKLFRGKFNYLSAYNIYMEPPVTPKPMLASSPNLPTNHTSKLFGIVYITLIPAAGLWIFSTPKLFRGKFNYLPAYNIYMELPVTPKPMPASSPNLPTNHTSKLFGIVYITLTG